MLLFGLLVLAAAPVGEIKTFGDWAVGCDIGGRCQMISLDSEDNLVAQEGQQAVLTREAGPGGAIDITLPVDATLAAPVSIMVDGKVYATLALPKPGDALDIDGGSAVALARALATGTDFAMTGAGGDPRSLSLKGASAALRYMDAAQGRVGTVSALVANGPKAAITVPRAPPLPRITAIRPPAGRPPSFRKALRIAIGEAAQCDDHLPPMIDQIDTALLDAKTVLALVPCGTGAYNFIYAAVLVVGGRTVAPQFEDPPAALDTASRGGTLLNATFDGKTGILNSHDKSRGPGDCGADEDYVWDGKRFRLLNATRMDECRGSTDWITTWRAEAVFR